MLNKDNMFEMKKGLDIIRILGRGSTIAKCPNKDNETDKKNNLAIEYWGCNDIYKYKRLDRLFIMHDPYMIAFNREEPDFIDQINKLNIPVYTLGGYSEIKNNVIYPMKEVIEHYKIAYFLNTISYILPLAIMQEPKQIELYGVDMHYGSVVEYMRNEKSCVEFWLGVAKGRGIKCILAKGSTLLKRKDRGNLYGFKIIYPKTQGGMASITPEYHYGCGPKCAKKYRLVRIGS